MHLGGLAFFAELFSSLRTLFNPQCKPVSSVRNEISEAVTLYYGRDSNFFSRALRSPNDLSTDSV